MHRRLVLAVLAALALSSCSAEAPAASTPVQTATATPTPSSTVEDAFVDEVRMKARTLTPELVDDEALVTLGAAACEPDDGQWQQLDARVNQGFSYEEVETVIAVGKRHLC